MYLCIKIWYQRQHFEFPGQAAREPILEGNPNLTVGEMTDVVNYYWKRRPYFLPNLQEGKRRGILKTIQALTRNAARNILEGMIAFVNEGCIHYESYTAEVVNVNGPLTDSKAFVEGIRKLSDVVARTRSTWLNVAGKQLKKAPTIKPTPTATTYHYANPDKPTHNKKRKPDNNDNTRSNTASEEHISKKSKKNAGQEEEIIESQEEDDTSIADEDNVTAEKQKEDGSENEVSVADEDNVAAEEQKEDGSENEVSGADEDKIAKELAEIEEWGEQIDDSSIDSNIHAMEIEGNAESSSVPVKNAESSDPVHNEKQALPSVVSTAHLPNNKNESIIIVEKQTQEVLTMAWLLLSNNGNDVDRDNKEEAEEEVEEEENEVEEKEVEEDEEDEEIKLVTAYKEKFKKFKEDFQKLEEAAAAKMQKILMKRKKQRGSKCK